ncbi:hypothetical protein V2J09_020709 [Rumex salicifolius]
MSRQLLCVILLLQFHACFASRGLVAFHDKLHHNLHKEEYLGSKETTMMLEARATLESSSQKYNESKKSNEATGEDIDFKDYAQPTRKPPIHNTKS